jgi:hypothetical protein
LRHEASCTPFTHQATTLGVAIKQVVWRELRTGGLLASPWRWGKSAVALGVSLPLLAACSTGDTTHCCVLSRCSQVLRERR